MQRFLQKLFVKIEKWTFIFVLFRNFLRSLCKNVTFVTDSSQNLVDTKTFCDHKKNFGKIDLLKKRI